MFGGGGGGGASSTQRKHTKHNYCQYYCCNEFAILFVFVHSKSSVRPSQM